MHPSLSAQTPAAGRRRRTFSHVPDVRWWQDLPAAWRDLVVVPVSYEVSREYEIAADRTQGHDEDSEPCYCTFRYALTELRSDEDDVFYEETVYAETLTAWRLRDERWLIYRKVVGNYPLGAAHSFFSLSESMPR